MPHHQLPSLHHIISTQPGLAPAPQLQPHAPRLHVGGPWRPRGLPLRLLQGGAACTAHVYRLQLPVPHPLPAFSGGWRYITGCRKSAAWHDLYCLFTAPSLSTQTWTAAPEKAKALSEALTRDAGACALLPRRHTAAAAAAAEAAVILLSSQLLPPSCCRCCCCRRHPAAVAAAATAAAAAALIQSAATAGTAG